MARKSVAFIVAVLLIASCNGGDDDPAAPPVPSTETSSPTTSSSTTTSTSVTTSSSSTSTTSPAEATIDVEDIPEREGVNLAARPAILNGVSYTNALVAQPYNSTSSFQINAGRTRKRFLGDVAIPDDQRSTTAYRVEISLDNGAPVFTTDVRFGETKRIDIDVTNVLRVKVKLTALTAGVGSDNDIAIGSPRFA